MGYSIYLFQCVLYAEGQGKRTCSYNHLISNDYKEKLIFTFYDFEG